MTFFARKTPTSPAGLTKYDYLPPAGAALNAWRNEGAHPVWHRKRKAETREHAPELARILDAPLGSATDAQLAVTWTHLHRKRKTRIRKSMPLLARALDRLGLGDTK